MGQTTVDERRHTVQDGIRSRGRRRILIAAIVVAVIAVLIAGWQVAAWSAVGGVRIVYDARPVVCEGAQVSLEPSVPAGSASVTGDEEFHSPVVEVVPGMTCGVRFHVVNDGWSDVTVYRAVLPSMNEDHVSLVRPAFVNPNGQTRLADTDDAAIFAIDGGLAIAPGSRQSFTVVLEADAKDADLYEACSGHMPRSPGVVVSALAVERTVSSPEDAGVWYYDGPRENCG